MPSTFSAGDVLIDLAWNIDACEILQWCHDRGVLYINTSVEVWDPYAGGKMHPTERTLYWRHMNVRRMDGKNGKEKGATAVIEHGANPGLISHFTKQGLIDIAGAAISEKKVKGRKAEVIKGHVKSGQFNHLAMELGVKVIHCSERDTHITDVPKHIDEFVNTWSIEGFREEGTTTSELGWGTHEKTLPKYGYRHKEGPKNQICIARMGMNTWGALLGAELHHQRHGCPPRRGHDDFGQAHRVEGQEGRVPADDALRLLPLRDEAIVSLERAARLQLRAAAKAPDHE